MREIWSDADLDTALAALRSDLPSEGRALGATRASLLTAAGSVSAGIVLQPPKKPRAPGWRKPPVSVLAAAAVIATIAIAVGVSMVRSQPADDYAAAPTASFQLERAATAAQRTGDPAPKPGQFRYIATHEMALRGGLRPLDEPYNYRREAIIEEWIPYDIRLSWLQRTTITGKYESLSGDEQKARAEGAGPPVAGSTDIRRPCGNYSRPNFLIAEGNLCTGPGDWKEPTPEFLAKLSRDPRKLLDQLREVGSTSPEPDQTLAPTPISEGNDSGSFSNAQLLISSGLAPADLRVALYRAMEGMAGIVVTDRVNLDGRRGIAVGLRDGLGGVYLDVLIDPDTGAYIGLYEAHRGPDGVLADGRVTNLTAVTTGITYKIGVRPGG